MNTGRLMRDDQKRVGMGADMDDRKMTLFVGSATCSASRTCSVTSSLTKRSIWERAIFSISARKRLRKFWSDSRDQAPHRPKSPNQELLMSMAAQRALVAERPPRPDVEPSSSDCASAVEVRIGASPVLAAEEVAASLSCPVVMNIVFGLPVVTDCAASSRVQGVSRV